MAPLKVPILKSPGGSNYLANVIARHIAINKPYPKKIPAIPSIFKSLPAVMRDFGGKI